MSDEFTVGKRMMRLWLTIVFMICATICFCYYMACQTAVRQTAEALTFLHTAEALKALQTCDKKHCDTDCWKCK